VKYRHLYRSIVLLILATAVISMLGLRGVMTHSHSDGEEKHVHVQAVSSSPSSPHHHEHPHPHGQRHGHAHHHAHAHAHPHEHAHTHAPATSSQQDISHDRLIQTVSPDSATEIASTHPHSHYVFFGFEFVVFESGNREAISSDGFDAVDLRSWLIRVFNVRSPLSPESLAFEPTPASILCDRLIRMNGGRVNDPPSTPPPEFATL